MSNAILIGYIVSALFALCSFAFFTKPIQGNYLFREDPGSYQFGLLIICLIPLLNLISGADNIRLHIYGNKCSCGNKIGYDDHICPTCDREYKMAIAKAEKQEREERFLELLNSSKTVKQKAELLSGYRRYRDNNGEVERILKSIDVNSLSDEDIRILEGLQLWNPYVTYVFEWPEFRKAVNERAAELKIYNRL